MSAPRPFKNPAYTKNASRRTKNLKAVLGQERERERLERERRRAEREEAMEVDGAAAAVGSMVGDDVPSCMTQFRIACRLPVTERRGSRFIHRGTPIGAATASVL